MGVASVGSDVIAAMTEDEAMDVDDCVGKQDTKLKAAASPLRLLTPSGNRNTCAGRRVLVPAEVASVPEAVAMGSVIVVIAPGIYDLPGGLELRGLLELVGDGPEGSVELHLGAPIEVRSEHGATFRNLTLRAGAQGSSALVRVHASYVVALGRARSKDSDVDAVAPGTSPIRFARYTWGKCPASVLLERCRLFGGRHGVEVRGSQGLRRRAGAGASGAPSRVFDIEAWLARCRDRDGIRPTQPETEAEFQLFPSLENASSPASEGIRWAWTASRGSSVRLSGCEVANCDSEAVSAWRGAHLEIEDSWVHHCGQGVAVSHHVVRQPGSASAGRAAPFLEALSWCHGPTRLVLRCSRFEDLSVHDSSAAIAIGRFVTVDAPVDAEWAAGAEICHYKAASTAVLKGLRAELFGNKVRRCSVGCVAFGAELRAEANEFTGPCLLGGWQLANVSAELVSNRVEGCTGAAVSLSALPGASPGSQTRMVRNLLRGSLVGVRMTSSDRVACRLEALEEVQECNGDSIIVLSAGCRADFADCQVKSSQRCGVRIGRGAHARLTGCCIAGNGRGIAVAQRGGAEVRGCRFEGNVGWALRFEGDQAMHAPAADQAESEPPRGGPHLSSVVSNNMFGGIERGNVGRKRMRIDVDEESVQINANIEAMGGAVVEPVLKRHRTPNEM